MKAGFIRRIRYGFRNMSLVRKFSSAVVLLILIIMMVINTLIITHQERTLRAELDNNRLVLAQKLAKDVVEPLIFMDPLRLDELVRTTAQTPGCAYAGVVDKTRRIVAHTNRKLLGRNPAGDVKAKLYKAMDKGEIIARDIGEDDIRELVIPVMTGYEAVGAVTVGFSKGTTDVVIENGLSRLKGYIYMISAAVLALGVWGSYGLARFLATPMTKLKDRMELVQIGNLAVETPDEHIPYCHEMLECMKKECPAYGRKRCWTIPGTVCFGYAQGDVFDKMRDCRNCVVYKESCGDEIGELVEVFNHMVKKLNDSMSRLEESAREKTRLEKLSALGEMSMTIAHEIKNPLNAIRGAASYLKDNFEGEVLKEFLTIIDEETRRLNEIVTSILRYSRPVPLKLQAADINKVISDTVDLVRQEATESNVEVAMSLDERVPSFRFDAQQVKQAVLNLLVNALEVTGEGGTIRIATEIFDSGVRVIIKDTGPGMSEEVVAEIFKPFFTTKTRGSGLGLACVERIVKDHKGDITVKSEPGKGAEFIITLPAGN